MDRRNFLEVAGAATTLPLAVGSQVSARTSASIMRSASTEVQFGDNVAIAKTTAGKVRGFISGGIFTFKGIPYGDTTAGANRFIPPRKPQPWTNVRDYRVFGPTCPQPPRRTLYTAEMDEFMLERDNGTPSEDCLRLNIWTPALGGKGRPVMVWLHPGGFFGQSSQGMSAYDGENLSRRGDVVVVSFNHRIGLLGFLDLFQAGPEYENSVNVSFLDIVAALEWTRDNIAEFGGDPKNVTVFGQSGGGGKVSTLVAMPAARGLFHKGIIQSGSELAQGSRESKQRLTAATLADLNLTIGQVAKLKEVPLDRLIAAGAVATKADKPRAPGEPNWGPAVGTVDLPRQPFEPDAAPLSADIPLMIGSTQVELASPVKFPELESAGFDEAKKKLAERYGDRAGPIVDAYRAAFPKIKPVEVIGYVQGGSLQRRNVVKQATLKAAQPAPVYVYWFGWNTKVLDGRPRAYHCSELPFMFNNSDRCSTMTGGTDEARQLAYAMSDAWIGFARSGNPNHKGLPAWPKFDGKRGALMFFDSTSVVMDDPDRATRQLLGT